MGSCSSRGSFRLHPDRAVETDHLAVQHRVRADAGDEGGYRTPAPRPATARTTAGGRPGRRPPDLPALVTSKLGTAQKDQASSGNFRRQAGPEAGTPCATRRVAREAFMNCPGWAGPARRSPSRGRANAAWPGSTLDRPRSCHCGAHQPPECRDVPGQDRRGGRALALPSGLSIPPAESGGDARVRRGGAGLAARRPSGACRFY